MIGNIFHQMRHGDIVQVGRVGVTDDDMDNVDRTFGSMDSDIAFLLLPLIYAWLLKPIGFYSATPFFIAAIICLLGEFSFKTRCFNNCVNIQFIDFTILNDFKCTFTSGHCVTFL